MLSGPTSMPKCAEFVRLPHEEFYDEFVVDILK